MNHNDVPVENSAVKLHRTMVMNRRVDRISTGIAKVIPTGVKTVLDVGAGTGEMAVAVMKSRPELSITGVDVYIRPKTFIHVDAYDGDRLPYETGSFDAVMIVDVLHHCPVPAKVLAECARVSRKWVIVKDHVANSWWNVRVLSFMDYVGNRAHGVVLPYNYLSSKAWTEAERGAGLSLVKNEYRLNIYPIPAEWMFGGKLHCLNLLEKKPAN